MKNKILLITNIPTPYRIPLFNELNRQLSTIDVNLKIIFGAFGYDRRKWKIDMSECKFAYDVLNSKKYQLLNPSKVIFSYSGLYKILKSEKPSLIITNGFSVSTLKLWLRSFIKKTNYIIWSGAILNNYEVDSWSRKIYRRLLIKRAKGFIAYGTKAKEYLGSLGADANNITIAINTVDTQYFREEVDKIHCIYKKASDSKKVILSIGHLIKRKRFDQLLLVVEQLSRIRQDFIVKIVGDGIELNNLKKMADQLKITHLICWEGYKQKTEIPKYLAEADCFVFTTDYDLWGLVLVEAMAAGNICISSIHAGGAIDLIKNEVNGYIMDFETTSKVAKTIGYILDHPIEMMKTRDEAQKKINKSVSIEISAEGFRHAITCFLMPIKN